jgi:hypothetical protein
MVLVNQFTDSPSPRYVHDHHSDHRDGAVVGFVHPVRFHRKRFPLDRMLAWMMEVYVVQLVGLCVDHNCFAVSGAYFAVVVIEEIYARL